VKYRPTADGLLAASDAHLIAERTVTLPLGGRVVGALGTGSLSPFARHATLHGPAIDLVAEEPGVATETISRPVLGQFIETLVALDVVAHDPATGSYRIGVPTRATGPSLG